MKFIRDKIIGMGNRGRRLDFHRWRDEVRTFEQVECDRDKVTANDFSASAISRRSSEYKKSKDASRMNDMGIKQQGAMTQDRNQKTRCSRCRRTHQNNTCPAIGKTCKKCNKPGHFAAMCKSRNVNSIEEQEGEQQTPIQQLSHMFQESERHIESETEGMRISHLTVAAAGKVTHTVKKVPVVLYHKKDAQLIYFVPDTGAEVNCVTQGTIEKFPGCRVEPAQITLKTADNSTAEIVGQCRLDMTYWGINVPKCVFIVLKGGAPLLSLSMCRKLRMIPGEFPNL